MQRVAGKSNVSKRVRDLRTPPSAFIQDNSIRGRHLRLRHVVRAKISEPQEETNEDFYTILGVGPGAEMKDIKRAYYGIMRECHPDLSAEEDSTDFCMLLNEIYETISDPDKRALYDDMAGFSGTSINPFLDRSFPENKVFVDEFACIGCRNCTNVCPKTFAIEEDFGRARVMHQEKDSEDKKQEAIDTCPVNCIHWVTAPQLSLLEIAMARMERIAVWALMSGSGANRDVFMDASLAWEKRQAKLRCARQEEEWGWSWAKYEPAQAARAFNGGAEGSMAGRSKEGRQIANLAAKASRACRVWKAHQANSGPQRQLSMQSFRDD